jgi:hypothetical protein
MMEILFEAKKRLTWSAETCTDTIYAVALCNIKEKQTEN